MELFTVGKKIHYGYNLPLICNNDERFTAKAEKGERLSLIFIERGSGKLLCNGNELIFKAPLILCLNENEVPKLIASSDFSATSIYFLPSCVNGRFNFENIRDRHPAFSDTEKQDNYLLMPFINRNHTDCCMISIDAETVTSVSSLIGILNNMLISQSDIYWPCRSRSILLELLSLVSRVLDNNKNIYNDEAVNSIQYINSIITYLQLNYQNKITINELAKIFNTNRTTLNEVFYLETNKSIIDYLIKYRVDIAAMFLRDTMIPIAEIMERVGFNNPTHFWRMFKKHTGFSPSQYRDKYCWVD